MKTVEFDAQFGNTSKKVKLVSNNYGGGGYQILIDNFYQGDLISKNGAWQAHLNSRSILTGDNITILIDLVEKRNVNLPGES